MNGEDLTTLAPRPASIAEWEDLLVRMEIMPRAVSGTLDAESGPATPEILQAMVEREGTVARWLEIVAAGLPEPSKPPGSPAGGSDPRDLAERFASLRSRNFAMLQRRGLEVWEWSGVVDGGRTATVHQVLGWLLASDASALAALRASLRSAPSQLGGRAC